MMAETGNNYRYGNGNMAEQTTTWPLSNHSVPETNISDHKSFYLFLFSHYILNDVDTSNCKAMISMIKATCFCMQCRTADISQADSSGSLVCGAGGIGTPNRTDRVLCCAVLCSDRTDDGDIRCIRRPSRSVRPDTVPRSSRA